MTQYLFLLRELVRRDFKGRYAGSILGFFWSFVQPLYQLILFSFVFSTVMKISILGERTENFGIFLFCGLLPWTAIQEGVMRSATAITENASLVKKLNFPSELLVLAACLAAILHEAIAAGIFVLVLLGLGEFSWQGLPLLLVALPLQIAMTLGLGLLLSSVHVFFRDTAQVLGMVFTGWFYMTPIVYPLKMIEGKIFEPWILWNPLTTLVSLYRSALLGGELTEVRGVVPLTLLAGGLLALGLSLFRKLKPAFADEI